MAASASVAVVGCGLIGRAWAVSFARGGLQVALYDPEPGVAEAAAQALPAILDDLAAADLLQGQQLSDWSGPVLDRIEAERHASLPLDVLGARQAWRDRRLMALLRARARAANDDRKP